MKVIIFGASLSGKTTTIRYLRKITDYNISEIDEEFTKMNNGAFPEDFKQRYNILKSIIKNVLSSSDIIFFTNTDYFSDQNIIDAKKLGFRIVQLEIKLNDLIERNKQRVKYEGYADLNIYLEGMVKYQLHLFKEGLVDYRIDATQPTSEIAKDLIRYVNKFK